MKKTKIVATVSDLHCDTTFIQMLVDAGVNVIRLNTAHQSLDSTKKIVDNIRKVTDKVAILLDTKGPELRITKLEEEFSLEVGDSIKIKGDPDEITTRDCIYVRYKDFVEDLSVGDRIMIDDGRLELGVLSKESDYLLCKALNDGVVQSRKSLNVPNVRLNLPALSHKDIDYIEFAIENELDFIAHSFVRNKEDLKEIQKILDAKNSSIKIIAKIENQEGVDNIDEILDHSYGVMVARGDLAVEIPFEQIPVIQKELIQKCIEHRKPVIVATQMLHSMIHNPRPTRAEISDIASAIYSHADAIMLSNETASGAYPIESVKTMVKVCMEVEKHKNPFYNTFKVVLTSEISSYLTKAAVRASVKLDAKAIIADTTLGHTIRNMAGFRGNKPIYARCYDKKVMRQLALSYGVYPQYLIKDEKEPEMIEETLIHLVRENILNKEDMVVVVAGNFGSKHGASFIEISSVEKLLKRNNMVATINIKG